jgi:hypothetical protein
MYIALWNLEGRKSTDPAITIYGNQGPKGKLVQL